MQIEIRNERPQDYAAVEKLTYKAFLPVDLPGRKVCDEHYLVHVMRKAAAYVPELSFVALCDGEITGSIHYTKSWVRDAADVLHEVLTFGPVSVLPEHQGKGIGGALIRHSLEKARLRGYKAVVIYGHPEYYARFGFVNAERFRITTPHGVNFDAFMALELYENALDQVSGRHYADAVYSIDRHDLDEFNKKFLRELGDINC